MSDYTRANLKPPLTLFKNRHCFSWNCYRWPMSATFVRTIQASVCLWSPQWTWKGAIVWGKRFSENFIKYKLCFGQADLLCSPVRRGISREQVFWVFLRINRKTNITLHTHSKAAQKPQQSPYLCILFLPRVFCSQRGSALISTDLFTPLLCFSSPWQSSNRDVCDVCMVGRMIVRGLIPPLMFLWSSISRLHKCSNARVCVCVFSFQKTESRVKRHCWSVLLTLWGRKSVYRVMFCDKNL